MNSSNDHLFAHLFIIMNVFICAKTTDSFNVSPTNETEIKT